MICERAHPGKEEREAATGRRDKQRDRQAEAHTWRARRLREMEVTEMVAEAPWLFKL